MASQSCAVSFVIAAGPSRTVPRTAKTTAASQVVCTATLHGLWRRSTGIASRVKPASQANTTTA